MDAVTMIPKALNFPAVAFVCGLMLLTTWHWVIRAPAVNYGAPGSVYFTPGKGAPGDRIAMHFNDVTWYRSCPSKLYTYFQPAKGKRIDLPVHEVSYPVKTGKLPGKARVFTIPAPVDDGQYGKGVVGGHVDSACWPFEGLPVSTNLPDVPLEIVRR